jgi:hypothetical protein
MKWILEMRKIERKKYKELGEVDRKIPQKMEKVQIRYMNDKEEENESKEVGRKVWK